MIFPLPPRSSHLAEPLRMEIVSFPVPSRLELYAFLLRVQNEYVFASVDARLVFYLFPPKGGFPERIFFLRESGLQGEDFPNFESAPPRIYSLYSI